MHTPKCVSTIICGMIVFISMAFVQSQEWESARATFYGDMSGGETANGACGYSDPIDEGYGLDTTALSTALFNDGAACGACYELQCTGNCKQGAASSIQVTATNFCPPNSEGGWCDPPKKHFDLSLLAFVKLAEPVTGVIPVNYRRVSCVKKGGMKFLIKGNLYFTLVLVYNVAGDGDVVAVKVRGDPDGHWIDMSSNWGCNWQTSEKLVGKTLSFQVTTSDSQTVESDFVAPPNWQFGQSYEGENFSN